MVGEDAHPPERAVGGLAMNQSEKQEALYGELMSVIKRYVAEFDITFLDMVGALELCKLENWALHTTNTAVKNPETE